MRSVDRRESYEFGVRSSEFGVKSQGSQLYDFLTNSRPGKGDMSRQRIS